MPINVSCHSCGKRYAIPDERAGQRFKCRECGTVVSVPEDEWEYGSGESAYTGNTGGFPDANNPYAAPTGFGASRQNGSRTEAMSKTNICAIFLYIVAGLSITSHAANAVITIATGDVDNPFGVRQPGNATERIAHKVGAVGANMGLMAMHVLVIVGAYNLQKLRSYPLAMTGAIIACIPCCGPCLVLGIPFGIWALVLLNNPDVKRHFQ